MTLHLIRVDPDTAKCARWFAAERLLPRGGEDDGYSWHALLCAVFGKTLAPKPFRVLARRGRPAYLLAYSGSAPDDLVSAALDFADPLALEALGMEAGAELAAKTVPAFAAGRRLGFSLRVRPTVRSDRAGDRRKTLERDVYVVARQATPDAGPAAETVYASWVSEKLRQGGANVVDLRVDGLDRSEVLRRDGTRAFQRVKGTSVSVTGLLEVGDAEKFAATVARGVGRHRAFGYGMLLLSPP